MQLLQPSISYIIISITSAKCLNTLWNFKQRAFYFFLFLLLHKYTISSHIHTHIRKIISVYCALPLSLDYCMQSYTLPKCYSLPLLIPHLYSSSTYIFVTTSQYPVFCVQIFDIQPPNARSTVCYRHILSHVALNPSKNRPISQPAASPHLSSEGPIQISILRQQPKSSNITSQPAPKVQAPQRTLPR